MMAVAEPKIEDVEFSTSGDRMTVQALFSDGELRQLLDVPTGRVHLEPNDLLGRTFDGAKWQSLCWLEAADDGIHRIIDVEIRRIVDGEWLTRRVNGSYEVVALMSDGDVVHVFGRADALWSASALHRRSAALAR
jgi:hypothetical protein